jgi:hypothetical protein
VRLSPARPRTLGRLRVTDPVLRALGALVVIDLVVLALHVANKLSGLYLPIIDLDKEQNLPTWLSSTQFVAVALGAGLLSREVTGRLRLAARVMVAVFLFLSLDESALIHEEMVQQVTRSGTADLWFWPVLYSPVAAGCVFAFLTLARETRDTLGSSLPLLAGFGLLAGAMLLDGASAAVKHLDLVYAAEHIVEEGAELLGGALLAAVMLALYVARTRSGATGPEAPEPPTATPNTGRTPS